MVRAEDMDEGVNAVTLYKIIRDSNSSSNFNDSVIFIEKNTGKLCSNGSLNIGAVKDFTEHVRLREHTVYELCVPFIKKKQLIFYQCFTFNGLTTPSVLSIQVTK